MGMWKLEPSGQFSMGSLYKEIFRNYGVCDVMDIWKSSIPAKIKIFLWQIARDCSPSGDQALKWHGPGDGKCVWCGQDESCDHIIFRCVVAQFMWSVIREATGTSWKPAGFAKFPSLVSGT